MYSGLNRCALLARFVLAVCLSLLAVGAWASIFGTVQGVVHDPQHRPIAGARVEIRAAHSGLVLHTISRQDGSFSITSVALGEYSVVVVKDGFAISQRAITLASDTATVLHLELQVGTVQQSVLVEASAAAVNGSTVTPTTLVSREDIAQTPGADRTNSMAMIIDYTPGAYMTHDMLHMRGGHQFAWQIDGVEIPNTNIASNLAAQIDPKDIDYVEVQRGSYTADVGDRTYGVFNVVPRSGFERDREAELVINAGNFLQTNDQLNFGDHTEKFAYYASVSGNRSDYGLAPPVGQVLHDADNGFGGFASLIYNRTAKDQLRIVSLARADFFQIPYDPSTTDFEAVQFDPPYGSSQLRDGQHETDVADALSYLHTFNAATVLQVSPFFHYNKVDYNSNPNDVPVATTYDRASTYGGAQVSVNTVVARNSLQGGLYSFGQHDRYLFGIVPNDGSAALPTERDTASGGVVEEYVSDNFRATSWLTLIAGLRTAQFRAEFAEKEIDPRFGVAVRVPKLNWVFRGFYGRFYQPPPLVTVACANSASLPTTGCSVLTVAQENGVSFAPLHGERDEEHQFGVQIPWRGWVLDADTFKNRVNNFLDHSNIGESSIYFPVTVDGALIRAWELTLRSPRLWKFGQAHVAYSNQIAEQRGAITGGLICDPATSPQGQCDVTPGYAPVDHDQRNTLNAGFNAKLPWKAYASTNVYYGSGFVNGDPDPATPYPNGYLPQHTTVDLAIGKTFSERLSGSVTATNVANRRVLLDNSLTFGGFHFNDPREIFGEVRYRFRF